MAGMQNTAGVLRLKAPTSTAPPVRVLWWPLDTGTGVVTGSTSQSGFKRNAVPLTVDAPLTMTTPAAAPAWVDGGGLQFTVGSNSRLEWNPAAGAARDFAVAMLNLASFNEGEVLFAGCELITPAGWGTSNTANRTVLSVGAFTTGNHGFHFRITSAEDMRFVWWSVGASATAQAGGTQTYPVGSGVRTPLVWELLCTGPSTFKLRTHWVDSTGVPRSTNFAAEADLSAAGTAAPGMCDGYGVRICGREHPTNERLELNEILRNVWLARMETWRDADGATLVRQMLDAPQCLPSLLREVDLGDVSEPIVGADGNADRGFGVVSALDCFVYLDAGTSIATHPQFSVEIDSRPSPSDPSIVKSGFKSTDLLLMSDWINTTDFEGLERVDTVTGGYKFGRYKTGSNPTGEPAFIFSGSKTDTTNRGRSEASWIGGNVSMPTDQDLWLAWRMYLDFEAPSGGEMVIHQWFHRATGANLQPCFSLELSPIERDLYLAIRYADAVPMTQADVTAVGNVHSGLYASLFQRWVDVVIKTRSSQDASGYMTMYVDGVQVANYSGQLGYTGPAEIYQDGVVVSTKPVYQEPRIGLYPPGQLVNYIPAGPRDMYVSRFFVSRDIGGYSLAQIRAALTA